MNLSAIECPTQTNTIVIEPAFDEVLWCSYGCFICPKKMYRINKVNRNFTGKPPNSNEHTNIWLKIHTVVHRHVKKRGFESDAVTLKPILFRTLVDFSRLEKSVFWDKIRLFLEFKRKIQVKFSSLLEFFFQLFIWIFQPTSVPK